MIISQRSSIIPNFIMVSLCSSLLSWGLDEWWKVRPPRMGWHLPRLVEVSRCLRSSAFPYPLALFVVSLQSYPWSSRIHWLCVVRRRSSDIALGVFLLLMCCRPSVSLLLMLGRGSLPILWFLLSWRFLYLFFFSLPPTTLFMYLKTFSLLSGVCRCQNFEISISFYWWSICSGNRSSVSQSLDFISNHLDLLHLLLRCLCI